MRSVIVLALGAVVAALSACNGTGDPTGATCPPNSTLTYETFGKAFFAANCDACHGAGGDTQPRLSSQETIRRQKDDVDKAAAKGPNATNTYMPDGRSVDDEERRKLGEWLACGAP